MVNFREFSMKSQSSIEVSNAKTIKITKDHTGKIKVIILVYEIIKNFLIKSSKKLSDLSDCFTQSS